MPVPTPTNTLTFPTDKEDYLEELQVRESLFFTTPVVCVRMVANPNVLSESANEYYVPLIHTRLTALYEINNEIVALRKNIPLAIARAWRGNQEGAPLLREFRQLWGQLWEERKYIVSLLADVIASDPSFSQRDKQRMIDEIAEHIEDKVCDIRSLLHQVGPGHLGTVTSRQRRLLLDTIQAKYILEAAEIFLKGLQNNVN
jgi:hypothetical protein